MVDLFTFLNSILGPANSATTQMLSNAFVQKEVESGGFIGGEGSSSDKLFFLQKGICRGFYVDQEGNEFTTNIYVAPTFMADLNAYLKHEPAKLNICSVTESIVMQVRLSKIYDYAEKDLLVNKLFRLILESACSFQQERQVSFITMDAKERYLKFLEAYKNLVEQIPLKYLASFLGIQAQSLSRIRKEVHRS